MEAENFDYDGNQDGSEGDGEQSQSDGGVLRSQNDELRTENKQLKSLLRKQGFQIAGINPDDGVGKLLYRAYDGEADVEKIREFAQEHGIDPQQQGGSQPSTEQPAPPPQLNGEERERQQAQQRLAALQGGSSSGAQTPSIGDRLAEAEAKAKESGDWSEWDRLQIEAQFQRT